MKAPDRYCVQQDGAEYVAYDRLSRREIARFPSSQVIHEIVRRKNEEHEHQIQEEIALKLHKARVGA